jgi:PPOX class probable FMN-dependent enzyme
LSASQPSGYNGPSFLGAVGCPENTKGVPAMRRIESAAELRALLGEPSPYTAKKFHPRLSGLAQQFIRHSPLLFLSTVDATGRPTVSPKGDAPGFVRVEGPTALLIPERKGNRLLMTLQNVLDNHRVGLLFVVPRTNETLRVHGTASLLVDDELCRSFTTRGRPALLVLRVEVEECFFHCGKAFIRSDFWNAAAWPEGVPVSFGAEIAENLKPGNEPAFIEEFDRFVAERYRTDL